MSDINVNDLKKDCESLIVAGKRLANSIGILLHGNLRSISHMIDQTDAAVIDWNGLILGLEIKLQQIEEKQNDEDGESKKHHGNCTHTCDNCISHSTSQSPDQIH